MRVIQEASGEDSVAPFAPQATLSVSSGSVLCALVWMIGNAAGPSRTTITDTAGNQWHQRVGFPQNTLDDPTITLTGMAAAVCFRPAVGATTVTAGSQGAFTENASAIRVVELAGVSGAVPDYGFKNVNDNVTDLLSGQVATPQPSLVLAALGTNGPPDSVSAGWVPLSTITTGGSFRFSAAYRMVSGGTQQAIWQAEGGFTDSGLGLILPFSEALSSLPIPMGRLGTGRV